MRPKRIDPLLAALATSGDGAYHVAPQIGFLVLLEALQILQNSRASVFDVLLGDLQCLLQLTDPWVSS